MLTDLLIAKMISGGYLILKPDGKYSPGVEPPKDTMEYEFWQFLVNKSKQLDGN